MTRSRTKTGVSSTSGDELVALWYSYAQRNKLNAEARRQCGDEFGAVLNLVRQPHLADLRR